MLQVADGVEQQPTKSGNTDTGHLRCKMQFLGYVCFAW